MTKSIEITPSPLSARLRGEREGPIAGEPSAHGLDPWGWEGEVGCAVIPNWSYPHLTPTLSAPEGGEGVSLRRTDAGISSS
jgi:hypothetical protein